MSVYAVRLPNTDLKLVWSSFEGFGSIFIFGDLNERDHIEIDSEFMSFANVVEVYNTWVLAGKPYKELGEEEEEVV